MNRGLVVTLRWADCDERVEHDISGEWEICHDEDDAVTLTRLSDGAPLLGQRTWLTTRLAGGLLQLGSFPPMVVSFARPPIVDVSALVERDDATEDERLVATQRLIDAAQDTGVLLLAGATRLQDAARRLAAAAQAALDGSCDTALAKHTLRTTSGLVKTSAVPPVFAPVVLPQFLAEAGAEPLVAAHFAEARRVAHVLLEALLQRDVPADELYGMLRLVAYPRSATLEPHSDKSWLTVVPATSLRGLQIVDADGSSFVDLMSAAESDEVAQLPCLTVGDALAMASGGAFLSRVHRAHNPDPSRCRVSLPYFLEPRQDLWPKPFESQGTSVVLEL